jgi:hypothetical protein
MSEETLFQWLLSQRSFKAEYEKLLIMSVSCQFSAFDDIHYDHDWNYLLKCASFLAHSKKAQMQDIALRISQFCLQSNDVTTDAQKDSAQFVLNILANRRAITLAKDKNLLDEKSEEWQKTFLGNLNWIKQEVEHSVWLKNGERINVNVFQRSFWEALNTYRTLSISAPTSAGKSHLIKQWILELVTEQLGCSIVYIVPTRALIAEVEANFQSALSEEIKASKVIVTSFPFIKFTDDSKSCIFILTQERLQLLLQRTPKKIDVIIIDEAYKLADDDRGILLQHVVERVTLINPLVKTVYISPLASNPEVLIDESDDSYSECYEDITINQNLIWASQKRGAKWTLELCYENSKLTIGEITLLSTPSSVGFKLPMLAFALGQAGGNIIYVNGAAEAEEVAHKLYDMIGFDNQCDDSRILALIELCQKVIHREYRLIEALKYRVAFHYGNITLLIREEVETLFREGVIKFLVCTSTLVEGVNLPCRNIFIRAPKRGNSTPMNTADFWNLAGRAGRWGKDFQGNIICIDPTMWNAPTRKFLTPITKATEMALARQDELIDFIQKGTPRAEASSDSLLESMASYLAISYKSYGSLSSIPWMQKIDLAKIQALENAVSSYLISDVVPEEIIIAHPGISPLAMAEMLKYFQSYKKPHEELLVPYATDTDAVKNYVRVFMRMFNRLTNEFGNNRGYIFREAIVTVHWMQGRPVKRIILERQKIAPANESIHATIRNVLKDIETIARYKAPKYIACYNDLLKHFFYQENRTDLAEEIKDITLFLEMGVNTTTHLSLMNLGLSRTSAVEVKEYITSDTFSEQDCINWFMNPNNNWRSRDLPEIIKREIEKSLKIHVQ